MISLLWAATGTVAGIIVMEIDGSELGRGRGGVDKTAAAVNLLIWLPNQA